MGRLGRFYSWDIVSNVAAIKHGDKSFVEYGETGIPKEILWFFDCEDLQFGEKRLIKLTYRGEIFDAHLEKGIDATGRTRLIWRGDFKQKIIGLNVAVQTYPVARFEKISRDEYEVQFINEEKAGQDENDSLETIESTAEGKMKLVYTTKYERNPENRKNAILIHGTKCMACGFDFGEAYGEYGKDYIEVHHVKPLSDIKEEVAVNPLTDLVCVCSNCHRMIHHKRNHVLSIDELKGILQSSK